MKYSFTTTALVGAVLAVTGSAAPISQQTSSSTISTPSFGPQNHTNTRGPFTAFTVLGTHAPTSYPTYNVHELGFGQFIPKHPFPVVSTSPPTSVSSTTSTPSFDPQNHTNARGPLPASYPTYDSHGLGFGQVVPEIPFPVVSTSLSTSVRRTPTEMHVTGSTTRTALFPNFHPHFGHGPVISERGFNTSCRNSNSTKSEAPASVPRPLKAPVHRPWQPHNELPPPSNLNGTTQRVPKSSLLDDHNVYCQKHWVKMTIVCEKWMIVSRWWYGDRHNHTKPHTHHPKPLKSLQDRSIHLSPRSSEVTSTRTPTLFSASNSTKASVTTIPAPTHLLSSQHEFNLEIVEVNSKIEFYKKQVGRANQEMRQLEKQCQKGCDDISLNMHKVQVVKAYNMEQLEHAREELARLQGTR